MENEGGGEENFAGTKTGVNDKQKCGAPQRKVGSGSISARHIQKSSKMSLTWQRNQKGMCSVARRQKRWRDFLDFS